MSTNTPQRQNSCHALPVLLTTLVLVSMISQWNNGGLHAQTGGDRVLFHPDVSGPDGAILAVGKQNFFQCLGIGEFSLMNGALTQDTQTPFLIYEYTTHHIDPRNAVYPSNGWLATHAWVEEQHPLLRFTRGRIYYVWTTVPLRMKCGTGLSINTQFASSSIPSSAPISSAAVSASSTPINPSSTQISSGTVSSFASSNPATTVPSTTTFTTSSISTVARDCEQQIMCAWADLSYKSVWDTNDDPAVDSNAGRGEHFYEVHTADFNQDGFIDILTTTRQFYDSIGSSVGYRLYTVWLGQEDGGFYPLPSQRLSQSPNTQRSVMQRPGHFNTDSYLDLLFINGDISDSNFNSNGLLLLGNGDGTFTTEEIRFPGSVKEWKIGDMNNNGMDEIVTMRNEWNGSGFFSTHQIDIFSINGTTLIKDHSFRYDHRLISWGIGLEDTNGDGWLDIILGNRFVFNNLQNHNFSEMIQLPHPAGDNYDFGDYNNDGYTDYLAQWGNSHSSWVILPGTENGNFSNNWLRTEIYPHRERRSINGRQEHFTFDMNNDGMLDMVLKDIPNTTNASNTYGSLLLAAGKGDGTFQSSHTVQTPHAVIHQYDIADFNHDGLLDIVVHNHNNSQRELTVFQAECSNPQPALCSGATDTKRR